MVVSPPRSPHSDSSRSINESNGSKSHSSSEESVGDAAPVIDDVRDEIICTIFNLPPSVLFYQDYACALVSTLAFQGRMYPASDRMCFYSNFFGKETKLLLPYESIIEISKTSTIFSQAILVKTLEKEYTFTSFWGNNRDQLYDLLVLLRNKCLGITTPSESSNTSEAAAEVNPVSPPSETTDAAEENKEAPRSIPMMTDDPTPMYDVMKHVFPISVEAFVNNFFTDNPIFGLVEFNRRKGATDIKCDPWTAPDETMRQTRSANFVLPVDAPIGPKSTRVNVFQVRKPLENDGYLFDTSTRLGDIPYGDYFSVEDRWILERVSDDSCELLVQIRVVFSKSTMWRGTIESRAKSECKTKMLEWIAMANKAMSPEGLPPYPAGSTARPLSPKKVSSPRKKTRAITTKANTSEVKPTSSAVHETKPHPVRRQVVKRNIMPILFPWMVVIFLAIYVYRVHSVLSSMEETMSSQQVVLKELVEAIARMQSNQCQNPHPLPPS